MNRFGIQHSSLSGQIQIGRTNKAETEFTAHEYHTHDAVWAVAEYIEKQMGGGMFIAANGKRYSIDVTVETLDP